VRIVDMSTTQFAVAAKRDPVVIIPVGAVEEHGPHLPLGADIFQPEAVLEEVSRRTGALVAPILPYGNCISTDGFPGTISVSFEALRIMMRDILQSFVADGPRRFVVLSGHAGALHMEALRAAARDVASRENIRIAVLSDYDFAYELLDDPERSFLKGDGHGGALETSRLMATKPKLVRGRTRVKGAPYPNRFVVSRAPEKLWPGVRGDPAKASAALGREVNRHVTAKLIDLVNDVKKGPLGA
jgi:creatinine amidohydrolase